ncbi:MAG: peptidoglycan DD-metalloendopeptidase family protein [Cyclobacteriaceae bacterium]
MESSELILYIMKVVAIHGLFFLLYHVILRKRLNYSLNRVYLLGTLLLAFFIPMMEIPVAESRVPDIVDSSIIYFSEERISPEEGNFIAQNAQLSDNHQSADIRLILMIAYGIIAGGLIIRSTFHLIILQKLKKQSVYVKKQWFKLFKTSQIHPFSFLTNVFIPGKIFGTDSFDQILEHECEHVRQYHSIDRLLVDFMAALFWFNPFMYLYRKALIEIHEYQADAAVLKKFADPIGYQEVLFSQLNSVSYSGLVSHFNFSTIKKRIVMINKQRNKRSVWAYVLAVPVTLLVVLAFSGKAPTDHFRDTLITEDSPEIIGDKTQAKLTKEKVEEHDEPEIKERTTEVFQEDKYTPSILPLKETEKMKVTSSFGMRMDPFDKKKKMHKGLDMATPIGTTVVATADGEVHGATYDDKYGYYVLIKHGDKYMTRYSQLSNLSVSRGDQVKRGQKIGLSGSSGRSTAPHLHYEVVETGSGHKNPVMFIKNHRFRIKEIIPPPPPKPGDNADGEGMEEEELSQNIFEAEEIEAEKARRLEELEAIERERTIEAKRVEEVALAEEVEYQEMKLIEEKERAEIERAHFDEMGITDNPMYILDGEVIEKSETFEINPGDIEHVEVMKGEKSKKKYGEDASGGVIIITTKKSKTEEKTKEKSAIEGDKGNESGKEDPRLAKTLEFLKGYEGDDYDKDQWSIVLKNDLVKLKKLGSLKSINLYNNYFDGK